MYLLFPCLPPYARSLFQGCMRGFVCARNEARQWVRSFLVPDPLESAVQPSILLAYFPRPRVESIDLWIQIVKICRTVLYCTGPLVLPSSVREPLCGKTPTRTIRQDGCASHFPEPTPGQRRQIEIKMGDLPSAPPPIISDGIL